MTIIWFLYATYDQFRPIEKQEDEGLAIAIIPAMVIDAIIVTILGMLHVIK